MRHTASLMFVFAASIVAGCGAAPSSGSVASGGDVVGGSSSADVCARAAAHVASCTGATPAAVAGCDAATAEQLLTLDCASLQTAAAQPEVQLDSLSLGGIACAAGIVRACPEPACTAPTYPGPSTTCSDYIGIAGCGGCQFYA